MQVNSSDFHVRVYACNICMQSDYCHPHQHQPTPPTPTPRQAVPFTEKTGKMQTGTATVAVLAEATEVRRERWWRGAA